MPALLQEQLKIKHQQRTGFGFRYQQKGLNLSSSGFKSIARDRNNKVNDYMNKAARKVIDYCIANHIGTLVVGYNEHLYLCKRNGMVFVKQEESYTSKASL